MKKILIVFLMVTACGLFANAQFYIGGGVGLDFSSTDPQTDFGFSLRPEVGYSLNDRFDLVA